MPEKILDTTPKIIAPATSPSLHINCSAPVIDHIIFLFQSSDVKDEMTGLIIARPIDIPKDIITIGKNQCINPNIEYRNDTINRTNKINHFLLNLSLIPPKTKSIIYGTRIIAKIIAISASERLF